MKIFKRGSMMQEHHKQSSEHGGERQMESATHIFHVLECFENFKGADINVIARRCSLHLYLGYCKTDHERFLSSVNVKGI
jgi:hypothetical protein